MSNKTFKDPIYGYIEIDSDIVHDVIDTATFQRLRNIRQTSYGPLYPGALHNRFIHSLGVFHLGKMAFRALRNSFVENKEKYTSNFKDFPEDWTRWQELFELACLLHDVGHSPFSHTGEEFYKNSRSAVTIQVDESPFQKRLDAAETEEEKENIRKELEERKKYTWRKHLAQLTGDEVFISAEAEIPAAHEIMSCVVALEFFGEKYSDEERSFFARCITGLQYKDAMRTKGTDYEGIVGETYYEVRKRTLLNCFIQLLHAPVIDVDRLDYIIRDASTIGYQSVSVDYERLLKGFTLVPIDEYGVAVGFHKNAISVIENAVYAHDNEKKWVQSHPTILYDSYLLGRSIVYIENKIREDYPNAPSTLFSYDSLTDGGSTFEAERKNTIKVRFLGDADLLHLMKNVYVNSYSEEYFKRNTRRLPLWKSEAEFLSFLPPEDRELITRVAHGIETNPQQGSIEINDTILEKYNADVDPKYKNPILDETREKAKRYISAILNICDKYGVARSVVLLSASFFTSNFAKGEVEKLWILFPGGEPRQLGKVSPILSGENKKEQKGENLYYIFYYPKEGRQKVEARQFAKDIITALRACDS